MKGASFVTDWISLPLEFTSAKLPEILSSAWNSVCEELHLDPSHRMITDGDIKENYRVSH